MYNSDRVQTGGETTQNSWWIPGRRTWKRRAQHMPFLPHTQQKKVGIIAGFFRLLLSLGCSGFSFFFPENSGEIQCACLVVDAGKSTTTSVGRGALSPEQMMQQHAGGTKDALAFPLIAKKVTQLTFSVISLGKSDTNRHELGVSRSPMLATGLSAAAAPRARLPF